MDPCGTPDEIFSQVKEFPSITTICFLFDKQQGNGDPEIPELHNLCKSLLWCTRQKNACEVQKQRINLKTIVQRFISHMDQLGYKGAPFHEAMLLIREKR